MYIDSRLQVSKLQALTASAASTDTIDLGSARSVGPGEPLWLVVVARTGLGGTSPTLAISIEADDNSSFSSATKIATGPTLAAADFATGKMSVVPVPFGNEQHMRAYFTLGGTSPTATVDAFFTNQDPTAWVSYPDGI